MKLPRLVQLGNNLCAQDKIILDLFKSKSVSYIGHDSNFASHLNQSGDQNNLILILNSPFWISDLLNKIEKYCLPNIKSCYLGINRYYLLGNDIKVTYRCNSEVGSNLINIAETQLSAKGFDVKSKGADDNDKGKKFNFIQPLTWIYATNNNNG